MAIPSVETVDNAVITSAITSPVWLPWLHNASEVAALLLPFAGLLWFAVRMGIAIHTTYFRKK